jgi:citrate lyase subunit beta/citryl-CoA lyase
MFVPGHNERLLASAAKSDADVLLLDLEDSVQPDANKEIARKKIIEWITAGKFGKHLVFPRINDRESGQLLQDVYQLTIPGVNGFMYPKAKGGDDLYFIDKLLETIEYEKKFKIGTFKLIPLIETSSAVLNAQEICKASNRIVAIAFGCEDFIADVEGIHDKEHLSLFTPRALIAMAARASGITPIDTVHVNVHDLADLEKNLILSKKLGFGGMLVLNPKELDLVNKYYTPGSEEIKEAEEMIKEYEQSQKEGRGVAIKDGKFIGPPMVLSAKKLIDKALIIKKKNDT